jgi:uncharacterized protein (DUF2267 family)
MEVDAMTQIASSLEVFDRTLHKTNTWLKQLMEVLDTDDRHVAYIALRGTLHALRDRLTVEEVAQLGAQLPMLIRGFYYEGWDPTGKPLKVRDREQFLARIAQEMRDTGQTDPARAASAVFRVLAARIAGGELEDVKQVLPADIRDLWR